MTTGEKADLLELRDWGQYVRQNGMACLGFVAMQLLPTPTATPLISLADAEWLDSAVAELRRIGEKEHHALILFYVWGYPDLGVARVMRMGSKQLAYYYRKSAVEWLYDRKFPVAARKSVHV